MKKILVFIGSIVSISCFLNGMNKTHSKKEKADKKTTIPHINFRMSSPKAPNSSRKNSVEDGATPTKIATAESLREALVQQRAELKKSKEDSPGRIT